MRSDELRKQQAYPLAWPTGWKRTDRPKVSPFKGATVASATWDVLDEIRLLHARDVVISTNVELRRDGLPLSNGKRVTDAGVAVYFTLSGSQRVLACDRWNAVEDNLRAVAKHVAAVRGQARWGVGSVEQAFAGYAALPERASSTCWSVLGLSPETGSRDAIRAAFAERAKAAHPDLGGDGRALPDLLRARDEALSELEARITGAA